MTPMKKSLLEGMEGPREIDLDKVDQGIERSRIDRAEQESRSKAADELIQESAEDLNLRQSIQAEMNELERSWRKRYLSDEVAAFKMESDFMHGPAFEEDLRRTEEKERPYKEAKALVNQALDFYAKDIDRIDLQRTRVETLPAQNDKIREEITHLRALITDAEKSNNEAEVVRLENELRSAEQELIALQKRPEEEAKLAHMQAMFSRGADVRRFAELYWPDDEKKHNRAVEAFQEQVGGARDLEGLFKVIQNWGAIPDGARMLPNTVFRSKLEQILATPESSEADTAAIEKLIGNNAVSTKFLDLYQKNKEELAWVAEKGDKTSDDLARQEEELGKLYEFVSSDKFQGSHLKLRFSKEGRAYLRMLKSMNIPANPTTAMIAVSLRLKAVRQELDDLEGKLTQIEMKKLKKDPGVSMVKADSNLPVQASAPSIPSRDHIAYEQHGPWIPSTGRKASLPKDPRQSWWRRIFS